MVEVLPFSATPELFYNWADVILMPSLLPESFGLVAIEAMSLGKLVIAASHGGLTEIIKNNVCGMLFEPGNDKDLALKISEIIQNPHLIFELGHKGFEVYKDKFSEEIYMKKLIEIIETSYPT
jgi:glycosyltransferase involved in cell wall biosynthesis